MAVAGGRGPPLWRGQLLPLPSPRPVSCPSCASGALAAPAPLCEPRRSPAEAFASAWRTPPCAPAPPAAQRLRSAFAAPFGSGRQGRLRPRGRGRLRRTWRRIIEEEDLPSFYSEEVARIKMLRRLARDGPPQPPTPPPEQLTWLQDQFDRVAPFLVAFLVLRVLYTIANPVMDEVPRGQMPSLESWLRRKAPPRPPGNYGGRPPPPREARAPRGAAVVADAGTNPWALPKGVQLSAVESTGELWESYRFATREIVEEVPSMLLEKNYVISLVLQLASFPKVYSNWDKYESCAVEEISLGPRGTVLGPLDAKDAAVPIDGRQQERELVLECGKMIDDYGLSLVARESAGGMVGVATLRVKRLPEGCHVDWDAEEDPSVVCTVGIDAVYEAAGLEAVAYLESIAVARGWRGSGLAASLLAFLEEKARTWGLNLLALHVHRDNWSALRFYQRRGFEITSDWLGWGPTFFLLLKPLQAGRALS